MTKTVTPRDVADAWRRWAFHLGESPVFVSGRWPSDRPVRGE